jgi:hypothetical protein
MYPPGSRGHLSRFRLTTLKIGFSAAHTIICQPMYRRILLPTHMTQQAWYGIDAELSLKGY